MAISTRILFNFFSIITILCLLAGVVLQNILPMGVPALFLLIYISIVNFRVVFYLLIACIPLSIEYQFPNGFGTDLPSEPLMVGLMLVYFLYALHFGHTFSNAPKGQHFYRNPMTLLLFLHFAWLIVATVHSEAIFFSFKYLLAKTWYIVSFYFLAALLLQKRKDFFEFSWVLFVPLIFTVVSTVFKHALSGFSFEQSNYVMHPFYRNHVDYACTLTVTLPFVILLWRWSPRYKKLLLASIFIILVGIWFSFTRAAMIGVLGAGMYYYVIKYRWTKYLVFGTIVGSILFVGYVLEKNKYLDFAPNFERAVSHKNFDNLVEATAKGEDVSTMERVYRWVAGFRMIGEKPFLGFGPSNFYNFYQSYTINDFKTYVSDNEEQSTIHCYYLLVAVESGIPGLIIFMTLVFYALLRGEQIYHRAKQKWHREAVLAAILSFVIILQTLLINDLVETDKIGSFFFINLAIIANIDILTRKKQKSI